VTVPGVPSGGAADGTPLDYDPESVAIRQAATVMLVDDRPDLHVLMLRRSARQVFATSMWVYPGGAVDPDDAICPCDGLDDAAASRRLGVDRGGLAYWVAAIRECFEEAGVLFASPAGGPADGPAGGAGRVGVAAVTGAGAAEDAFRERLAFHRDELNAGRVSFGQVVEAERLVLHADRLHPVGHWITPLGPPRRFDTRFFLAAFPEGQVAAHDEGEAVHHDWVRPAEALEAWRADRMEMMSPTVRMLTCLAAFRSARDAVSAAGAGLPAQQVRVIRNEVEYRVMLPGDPGYEDGDGESEFGRVSLRPPAV
jgi:8-oxo-dGTP pyrophosphatase MutT (NUDIX family)